MFWVQIHDKMQPGLWKHIASQLATIVPYLIIFVVWYYFAVTHPVPFWQELQDWSWYSLSRAFTTESIYAGYHAFNHGNTIHPGIPLGIFSWVALRLSTIGLNIDYGTPSNALDWLALHVIPLDAISSEQRIRFAVDHVERYWLCARGLALLLNLAGMFALWNFLGRNKAAFFLGCGIYFSMIPEVFTASLIQLTNETFSLPFIVGYYTIVYRFFESCNQRGIDDNASYKTNLSKPGLWAFAAGAAAAFGCSIKIYYLTPAIAFAFGILVSAACDVIQWRSLWKFYALLCAGFIGVGAIIVLPNMSSGDIMTWVNWNWAMLTHVEEYGRGAQGLYSIRLMWDAIVAVSHHSAFRFPIILLSVFSVFAFMVGESAHSSVWRRNNLPFCAALMLGFCINLFGLLKHYAPHYSLLLCATVSCLLLVIEQRTWGRQFILFSCLIVPVLFVMNLFDYSIGEKGQREAAATFEEDSAKIDALPIKPGERRVWVYYSATKAGVVTMVKLWAGSPLVSQTLEAKDAADISPIDDPNARDWKYVIFPKLYFSSADSVRRNYRYEMDIAPTQFQMRNSDKIAELKHFFVLTRTAGISISPPCRLQRITAGVRVRVLNNAAKFLGWCCSKSATSQTVFANAARLSNETMCDPNSRPKATDYNDGTP